MGTSDSLMRFSCQAGGSTQQPTEEPKRAPAVSIKKSVQPDYIICLEDGKRFKSLKRHLRTVYDLTPEQYRAKGGPACRLPDGGPELRRGPLRTRPEHGPGCPAQNSGR